MALKLTLKPDERIVVNGCMMRNSSRRHVLTIESHADVVRGHDLLDEDLGLLHRARQDDAAFHGIGHHVRQTAEVHFVARRHDAFTKPAEIGKPQVFDNDPSRKAFAPAIVSGKARGEREIRFHIVRVAGLKPIPEAGISQFGSPFRVAIAVTGRY